MSIQIFVKYRGLVNIFLGALLGYAYWYYIGCASGVCPLTSVWYTSTTYGALLGFTFGESFLFKKSAPKV